MPDSDDTQLDFGRLAGAEDKRITLIEVLATVASLIWIGVVVLYALSQPDQAQGMGLLMRLWVVVVPLGLIWATALSLRALHKLRDEAAQLRNSLETLRKNLATSQQNALVQRPERAAARMVEPVTLMPSQDLREDQPGLGLDVALDEGRPQISLAHQIKALQFPDGPDDEDGIQALRMGLQDRDLAKLIRSAQDVLTLLSQEGIFMDDLQPDLARPELWRKFAAGERGREIADIGGVRDRASLALTAGRMREDPVFRDAGHHFLRTFDRSFQVFEQHASDSEIAALSETRTARAFMLFGRVMGVFD